MLIKNKLLLSLILLAIAILCLVLILFLSSKNNKSSLSNVEIVSLKLQIKDDESWLDAGQEIRDTSTIQAF